MRHPVVPATLALSVTAITSLTLPGVALAATANSVRFQLDFENNCFTTEPVEPTDINIGGNGLSISITDLVVTLNPNVIPPDSALCEQYREEEGPADEVASDITPDEAPAQNTLLVQQSTDQIRNVSQHLRSQRYQAQDGANITYSPLDGYIGGAAGDTVQLGRLSVFINGSRVDGSQDNTAFEVGYDLETDHYTLGADYRFSDDFIAGFAYGSSDTTLEYLEAQDQTENDTDHYILYGNWYRDNFSVDTVLGFARGEIDTLRDILGNNAIGNTDSDLTYFSIAGSYDIVSGGLTYGPLASFDYVDGTIDSYSETNGGGWEAAFDEQDVKSQIFALGGDVAYAASFRWGVLIPHARAEWRTELEDDRDLIVGRFVVDPASSFSITPDELDSSWYLLSAGVSAQFPHGIAVLLNYEEMLEYDDTDLSTATLGVRWEM